MGVLKNFGPFCQNQNVLHKTPSRFSSFMPCMLNETEKRITFPSLKCFCTSAHCAQLLCLRNEAAAQTNTQMERGSLIYRAWIRYVPVNRVISGFISARKRGLSSGDNCVGIVICLRIRLCILRSQVCVEAAVLLHQQQNTARTKRNVWAMFQLFSRQQDCASKFNPLPVKLLSGNKARKSATKNTHTQIETFVFLCFCLWNCLSSLWTASNQKLLHVSEGKFH